MTFHKIKKPPFGAMMDTFWHKNFKTKLLQKKKKKKKKIVYTYLKSTSCCNFIQKLKKFHALTFHNTLKASFWSHFGPLLALNVQNKVIPKKNKIIIWVSFKSLSSCNFMQKSQNSFVH